MRRVVKPSIELMEALPTVIIGFLAGLWFAPIVESHLAAVVALTLFLPLSTILIGLLWHALPKAWTGKFANGWHAAILMPAMVIVTAVILSQSGNIEALLFAGDVRVYLAEHGIDFDQRNALVVGFAMGFAVIPTIFTIAEDAIFSVPKHLSDGSLALGATPWQTLIHVVLLTASPGIFSAIMMGLGRAVGETMIVLMATGNTPIMDWNILEGMRTLSATIAVEMPESEVGSSHYRLLFLAALLLLVFTFAVNSLAEYVRQRLREKYRSL
jgi:phosphate transport system permease protein